ncbi:hypothetical protein JTB14_024991 [Gonioctena quinquepunctata]|nr:hypothetical protein JTB14_024991 [Gonioctena quinquepunctata]
MKVTFSSSKGAEFEHDWPLKLRHMVEHFMPTFRQLHTLCTFAGHSVENLRWSWVLGVYDGEQAKVRSPPTPAQRIIWSIIPALDLKVHPQNMLGGGCICWR